ncbi:hypothetical protein A33M_2339 [Rhodovulum sp. PH10]|nr:hypothetical protein A33M_2339 [Rhodovulum sp. PH10]
MTPAAPSRPAKGGEGRHISLRILRRLSLSWWAVSFGSPRIRAGSRHWSASRLRDPTHPFVFVEHRS